MSQPVRVAGQVVATTAQLLRGLEPEEVDLLEAGLERRGYAFALTKAKRLAKGESGGILTAAMAYREWNGLPPSADGAAILKALRRPCCGLIDDTRIDPATGKPVERAITFGRWRRNYEVTVAYRFSRLPDAGDSILASDVRPIMQAGLDVWSAHCGIKLRLIDDFGRANIQVVDASIDRLHNVLADMYLPGPGEVGEGHVCKGRIDWNEEWGFRKGNATLPPRSIDLLPVWAHEFGHALGLDHEPGHGDELMNPAYWGSPTIYTSGKHWLGPKDIRTAQGAYGPPAATPTPPPVPPAPPTPAGPVEVTQRLAGTISGSVRKRFAGYWEVDGVFSGEAETL